MLVEHEQLLVRSLGCLLGGALGDVMVSEGKISAKTQMALFTAEGLLRAEVRFNTKGIGPIYSATVTHAYLRWLTTQDILPAGEYTEDGWLIEATHMHRARKTDPTSIRVLRNLKTRGERAPNQAQGWGGLVRVSPMGILGSKLFDYPQRRAEIFNLGCELAWITHGHENGFLPAGCFAVLIAGLCHGLELERAIQIAADLLPSEGEGRDVRLLLEEALSMTVQHSLFDSRQHATPELVFSKLGPGKVAHEVLAQAILFSSSSDDFESCIDRALLMTRGNAAVAFTVGSILGASRGVDALGRLEEVENLEIIATLANDLARPEWNFRSDQVWARYPGH